VVIPDFRAFWKRRFCPPVLMRFTTLTAALLIGFGLGRLDIPQPKDPSEPLSPVRPSPGVPSPLRTGPVERPPRTASLHREETKRTQTSDAAVSAAAGDLRGALRSLITIKDPTERRAAVDELVRRLPPQDIHRLFQEYDRMQGEGDFAQHPNITRAAASTWELIVASLVERGPEEFLGSRLEVSGIESSAEEFESILGAWAEKDLDATLAYFKAHILPLEPAEFQGAAASLANNFFRLDPDRATVWLQSLPEATRNFCGPYALRSLAQQDPATAARLLAAHESLPERSELSQHAAQRWARTDPAAAFTWASQLPADLAVPALRGVMDQWMQGDFQTAARYADHLDPTLRAAALPALTDQAPETMFPSLARQMQDQPGDEHLTAAAAHLTHRWAESDPTAASQWLLDQPHGPLRDAAIRGFTERLAQEDPDSAFNWAAVIVDPDIRSSTLDAGIRNWLDTDPEAARQWVQSSNTLSATDRDRLLRRTGR
jgi:hypothetical protein